MAHAAGPGRFPVRGGCRRPLLRLLHRASHAHVLRDALAGLRPDRLHGGLQVEEPHRRRRRHPEPLATAGPQVPLAYCYFTFAVAGLAMLALRAIVDSPFGYALP